MIDEKIKAEAERRFPIQDADTNTRPSINFYCNAAFIAGANFGKEMRWVKVEDETPKEDAPILVYKGRLQEPEVSTWTGAHLVAWRIQCKVFGITHWMPLPPEPGRGE